MLKKYILILISVLTLNSYCFGAFPDVDEVKLDENNIYLVHVTPFLMRDSTAIAGAAIKKTLKERVLLPSDLCMETRKTLSMLVNCHAGVSAEMALKLAKAFNTTLKAGLISNSNIAYGNVRKRWIHHMSRRSYGLIMKKNVELEMIYYGMKKAKKPNNV